MRRSIRRIVNGTTVSTFAPGCTGDSCAQSTTFTLNTANAAVRDGSNTVVVRAIDVLGFPADSPPLTLFVDRDKPEISVTHDELPSDWTQQASITTKATASDASSGVSRITLSGGGLSGQSFSPACASSAPKTCPSPVTHDFTYSTDALDEGIDSVTATATDAASNQRTTAPWIVKVDRSDPTMSLSGALKAADGTTLAPGTYGLQIDASDGDGGAPATARSGVVRVDVTVDDESALVEEQDCAGGSCSMSRTFTFDTGDVTGGSHDVVVTATDAVGRSTSRTLRVTTACCLGGVTPAGMLPLLTEAAFGDFDGDGSADMLLRNTLTGALDVRLGDGRTISATGQNWGSAGLLATGATLSIGDFNNDGASDVMIRPAVSLGLTVVNLQVLLSTRSAFAAPADWGTWQAGREAVAADVDGDGADDVIGRSTSDGTVQAAYSTGAQFDAPRPFGTGTTQGNVSYADVTGDGNADQVTASTSGAIEVASSTGSTLTPPISSGAAPAGAAVAVGDVDGDGISDVLARSAGAVTVAYGGDRLPDGFRSFGASPENYKLTLWDLNGDDKDDLIGVRSVPSALTGAAVQTQLSTAPLPNSATADDPADAAAQQRTASVAASAVFPGAGMRLAAQDDNRLVYRRQLPDSAGNPISESDAFGSREPEAQGQVVAYLKRLRQMGVDVMRFNVWWGIYDTGRRDAAGYPELDFSKLDKAVDLARDSGMQVYLTLSGTANKQSGFECSRGYLPDQAGCVSSTPATGDITDITAPRRPTPNSSSAPSSTTTTGQPVRIRSRWRPATRKTAAAARSTTSPPTRSGTSRTTSAKCRTTSRRIGRSCATGRTAPPIRCSSRTPSVRRTCIGSSTTREAPPRTRWMVLVTTSRCSSASSVAARRASTRCPAH